MKRTLSFLLTLLMLVTSLPLNAFIALAQELTAETQATAVSVESFRGKTVSILSGSTSTFDGVSNNTAANSTIGKNAVYYTEGRHGVYLKDTWWQQSIDALGMRLLVNNSWSGACVFTPRMGEASVGCGDRAVNLHNDHTGEEPDVIIVYHGANDYSYYTDTYGKAADVDYAALICDNADGTYTYATPTTACEAYAIMLHKILTRYPKAEVFCMTSICRREPDDTNIYTYTGQPTAYIAEMKEIIAHFGLTAIDLENCIPKQAELFDLYIADKRAHPNALGMDRITNAVLSGMLGKQSEIRHVTSQENLVREQAVLLGGSYCADVKLPEGYSAVVTMDGKDVTSEVYKDGKITVPNVTGDISVTADRQPMSFRWEIVNDELVSVGACDNPLEKLEGTITNGQIQDGRYALTTSIHLKHDHPWVVEWKCAGAWRAGVLSPYSSTPVEGESSYYLTRTVGGQLCFGTRAGSGYDNYGVDISYLDDQMHTFRLENRITSDGGNMVWLYIDGTEIGPMNNYYLGSNSQNATSDWVRGKDFCFSFMGTKSNTYRNCHLDYFQVDECSHIYQNGFCIGCGKADPATPVSLSLSYDDRYDVAGKEVEIIDAGKPTSYQVGYGVAEGTLDTAVVTLDGDKLIATGIGTAKVKIDGVTYTVTVKAAPISLFMITGHSMGAGQKGSATQSVICPEGQVYSSHGTTNLGSSTTGVGISYAALTKAKNVNAFTLAGEGTIGEGSALAWEYNKLTGEKVWVLNTAVGGSNLSEWIPGTTNYKNAVAQFRRAQAILSNEIRAGHYTLSDMGILYHNGANFGYKGTVFTQQDLQNWYDAMWNGFKTEFSTDLDGNGTNETASFLGLIPIWTKSGGVSYTEDEPAGLFMAASDEYPDIFTASVIGRDWLTNANVAAKFPEITYTTQNETVILRPTTTAEVFSSDNVHYLQVGYNAVGIDIARNIVDYLNGTDDSPKVTILASDGKTAAADEIELSYNTPLLLTPVVEPITENDLTFTVEGCVSLHYPLQVTATGNGEGSLTVSHNGKVLKKIHFTCKDAPVTTLALSYDDRYDVTGKEVEILDAGTPTSNGDAVVALEGNVLRAVGVGTAEVKIDGLPYTITVKKAKINLVMIMGQSNAGNHFANATSGVTCPPGTAYHWGYGATQPTDYTQPSMGFHTPLLAELYAQSVAAGDPVKNVLIWAEGYTSKNGQSIVKWASSATNTSGTDAAATMARNCRAYYLENSDKYEIVGSGVYWLQGESDYAMDPQKYIQLFTAMWERLKDEGMEYVAFLRVRGPTVTNTAENADVYYNSASAAQFELVRTRDDMFMASTITENWTGVASTVYSIDISRYLSMMEAYGQSPEYSDSYGNKATFADGILTTTMKELYGSNNKVHYGIFGYGIIGADAAYNMYHVLNGNGAPALVQTDSSGTKAAESIVPMGSKQTLDIEGLNHALSFYPACGSPAGILQITVTSEGRDITEQVVSLENSTYGCLDTAALRSYPNAIITVSYTYGGKTEQVAYTLLYNHPCNDGHDYTATVTPPTCTEKGYTTYTCSCGESYVADETAATGHTYANGICTVCGEKASPYLQQLPENIIGCTNLYDLLTPVKGYYTATKYDTSNGDVLSVVIPVESGDRISASSFGSVSENMGSVDGIRVTYLLDGVIVESLSASSVYTAYTQDGYLTVPEGVNMVCVPWWKPSENNWLNLSQISKDYEIHKPKNVPAQAPTCTENGYTAGEICEICNASIGTREEIPAVGHKFVENFCTVCGAFDISAFLSGKYVSILGDSISTFNGYSNDGTVNTTIGANGPRYDVGTADTKPGSYCLLESVDDTWWMHFANRNGMHLLVNNSWAGSQVFGGKTADGRVIPPAYLERCVNLHDNTLENNPNNAPIDPDVIFVYLGINDYNFNRTSVGSGTVDYAKLIGSDGTYVTPATFGEAYGILLHKMKTAYPEAQIFAMTLLPENLYSIDMAAWEMHNAYIRAAADYYGIPVVDLAENCAITWENYSGYMMDKIHPTTAGMKLISDCIQAELTAYYTENPPHIHSYTATVTKPTCTEKGYTTYTCTACGDSYVADETAATGHTYANGICTVCGEKEPLIPVGWSPVPLSTEKNSDRLAYKLENGVLVFHDFGDSSMEDYGRLPDYTNSDDQLSRYSITEWYQSRADIHAVRFDETISYVGQYTLTNMDKISEIRIDNPTATVAVHAVLFSTTDRKEPLEIYAASTLNTTESWIRGNGHRKISAAVSKVTMFYTDLAHLAPALSELESALQNAETVSPSLLYEALALVKDVPQNNYNLSDYIPAIPGAESTLAFLWDLTSGFCGESVTYRITAGEEKGTFRLSLQGNGSMTAYAKQSDVPWNMVMDAITDVTIEDGVNGFCDLALPKTAIYRMHLNSPAYAYAAEKGLTIRLETLRILCIGNSHTVDYSEFLPSTLKDLQNAGLETDFVISKATIGSIGLYSGRNSNINATHRSHLEALQNSAGAYKSLKNNRYDLIIIQDYMESVVDDPQTFAAGLATFIQAVRTVSEGQGTPEIAWFTDWVDIRSTGGDSALYDGNGNKIYLEVLSREQVYEKSLANIAYVEKAIAAGTPNMPDFVIHASTIKQNAMSSYLGASKLYDKNAYCLLERDTTHLTYELGRYLMGAGVLSELINHYSHVLDIDGGSLNVGNALTVENGPAATGTGSQYTGAVNEEILSIIREAISSPLQFKPSVYTQDPVDKFLQSVEGMEWDPTDEPEKEAALQLLKDRIQASFGSMVESYTVEMVSYASPYDFTFSIHVTHGYTIRKESFTIHICRYTATVTPPTCTEKGYTTYTCACGDSYVGDYVDADGEHDFTEWYTTKEATYNADGEESRDCQKCSHVEFRSVKLEVITSGNVGKGTPYTDDVTYTLYADGTMVISGKGIVYCSDWRGDYQPYKDYRAQIKTLIVEDGITTTAGGCFAHFYNLETVSLPDSLTKIGNNAFMSSFSGSVTDIVIPKTITYIGAYSYGFYYGKGGTTFTDIIIENPDVQIVDNNAVFNAGNNLENLTLYSYGNSNNVSAYAEKYGCKYVDLETYKTGVYSGVEYMYYDGVLTFSAAQNDATIAGEDAPWNAVKNNVKKIVIESGITGIAANAFKDYYNLESVETNNGIRYVGDNAFATAEPCDRTLTLALPRTVKSIGSGLFAGRQNVTLTAYLGSAAAEINSPGVKLDLKKQFKLLLIGNSYSEDASGCGQGMTDSQLLNILQAMLGDDAEITVALLSSGGKGMHWHATQAEQGNQAYGFRVITTTNPTWKSLGSYTSADALAWTDWDAVSLQPYNINPSTGHESVPYPDSTDQKFYHIEDSSAYMLDHVARYAPYADIYFYMHWAQTSGTVLNAALSNYNKAAAFMPTVLNYVGTESGARFKTLIPVGLSVQNARTTYLALLAYNTTAYADGNLNLVTDAQIGLQRDGGHLSFNIGRYIAGLTFAEMIIPPEMRAPGYVLPDIRVTESIGVLPKEYTEIAQKAVWAAVESWKNGSLAVTEISGYTEDPAITAKKELEAQTLQTGCQVSNEALQIAISSLIAETLGADFVIESVTLPEDFTLTGKEQTFTATVSVRFGYTTVTVTVSGTIASHNYTATITPPTCTAEGYTTYTCHCGDSYVADKTPATDHTFGEWTTTKEATCTANGEQRRDCKNCDHFETKVIAATGHSYQTKVTKPTCTEYGFTTYTCHCGDSYTADVTYPLGYYSATTEVLPAGSTLTLQKNNTVITNKHMRLLFDVKDLNNGVILLGHGKTAYGSQYVELTADTLRICTYNSSLSVKEYAHNLSIDGTVEIRIDTDCVGNATIIIRTASGTYQKTCSWSGRNGPTFCEVANATITNVDFRWYCENYDSDIWFYGDSYFHTTSTARWTSYLLKDGYTDVLLEGYPGMGAATALAGFEAALQFHTPKYAIWCMGMNNGDKGDAINTSWLNATARFLSLCEEYGIVPILTTIPSTAKVNNDPKNQWVKNSGYRYIDFDYAVVADPVTDEWYEDYLSTDLCHPNVSGAEQLYLQVILDFPELLTGDHEACKHILRKVSQKNALCQQEGCEAFLLCTLCGETFSADDQTTVVTKEQLKIPATGHSYGAWYTVKEATCTENGLEQKDCKNCDHYESKEIPAIGHSYTAVITKPSCTEEGYTTYTCYCGDSYVSDKVSATGHTFGAWYTVKEATCTEYGMEQRNCKNCDHYETKAIAATGHSYQATITKPTCTEDGYTTYTCHCGDSYVADKVPATGHSFGEWETVKDATCTADGEQRRDCKNCDHFETKVIAATGHSYKATITKPTCTAEGYTTYTCHCGDSYVADKVPATGHSFGAWETVKEATCTANGEQRRECKNCDHFETKTIAATGHSYQATITKPTCTTEGYTTYTCHCGDSYVADKVPATGHTFSEWETAKEATCTKEGEQRRECANCDHYETKVIPATGHSYQATITKPTCTTEGYTTYTCHCGDSYVADKTPATGHTFGEWTTTKEATCTTNGEQRRDCKNCDHYETKVIPATGHSYQAKVTKPTCTAEGFTTYTCHCGDTYVADKVPATGHSFGEWTTTKEATCTANGEQRRECKNCDHYETKVIAATGHNYQATITKPTCTAEGYTTYTCHCGDTYVADETPATGHSFGEWETVKEATCTANGEQRRECKNCDHFETKVIAATGHNYQVTITKPTCTAEGYTTYTCHCGDSYVADKVPATGHSFGEWTTTKEATCTTNGEQRRDCKNCDHFETKVIPATGHSYQAKVTKPTCTTEGYTTYTCHCGDSYVADKVPATGHNYGEWTTTKDATCTKDGEQRRDCKNCDHFETKTIAATGHSYTSVVTKPTCTTEGYTTYTCHCGDSYVADKVPATGHSFGDWETTKEATCTENGSERRDCANCDHYETKAIPATGHSYKATVTKPTCTTEGFTTYTCHCGDSYVADNVPALGHTWDGGVVTKEPTEEAEGTKLYTCTACGKTRTEVIPTLDHVHRYETTVTQPTCTAEGFTTYTCRCGDTYVADYVNATGHTFGEWQTVTEATCIDDGTERRDCNNCDHFETKDIPATGHTYQATVTNPTCTEKGYVTYTCHCGDNYVGNYTPATGHAWDGGVVTQEPTEDTTGTKVFTCTTCGETRTETLPRLDHVHKYEAFVTPPTCTADGYTTYTCACGDSYVADKTLATGHTYGEWETVKDATCTANGEQRRECANCDHYETKVIAATGHKYDAVVTAPTCTEKGFTTYTCHCGDTYVDNYVDPTGHAWTEWHDTTPGKEERSCTACGKTESRDKVPNFDVDGNGVVDQADVELLMSILVGNTETETLYDFDFDGILTIYDCVLLMQQLS